jgi:hypothetical protein
MSSRMKGMYFCANILAERLLISLFISHKELNLDFEIFGEFGWHIYIVIYYIFPYIKWRSYN